LADAHRLLARTHLLTLTGVGGVGKTRLALRLADRLRRAFTDGVWLADLTALAAGCPDERLHGLLAMALGVTNQSARPALDVLVEHVRDRQLLLVLDNCEHVLGAVRAFVGVLLRSAPRVRVLATSRQALAVEGEHTLAVPPLAVPAGDWDATRDLVANCEAAQLLADRAEAVAGPDVVSEADPRVVSALCRRLDGLPLAIQLAAGRLRALSIEQLLARLDDRFRLLTGHDVAPQRHATLERVVDWSHELCTVHERWLWARASVFAGGFDLEAAEAVCVGDDLGDRDVLDLVTGLVDKSILVADHRGGRTRYRFLDTLRHYGWRKLAEAGESVSARHAHRDYYLGLVAGASRTWLGPDEVAVMAGVHSEMPNLLAALDFCVEQPGETLAAGRICRDLIRTRAPFFWGGLDTVRQQFDRVLPLDPLRAAALTRPEETAEWASVSAAATWLALCQGRQDAAQQHLGDCLDLVSRNGAAARGAGLFVHGNYELLVRGNAQAIELLAEARTEFRRAGAAAAGDEHMATLLWAMSCGLVGTDPAQAVAAATECLDQARAAGAPWAQAWALWALALATLRQDDPRRAEHVIGQSLRLQRDMDDQWGRTWGMELFGWILAAQLAGADNPRQSAAKAAWLLGAAEGIQQRIGVRLTGLVPFAAANARARGQVLPVLGEQSFQAQIAAGARCGADEAVRLALGEQTAAGADRGTPQDNGSQHTDRIDLTPKERQVAQLVAEGMSNRQVGERLYISARTAETHVGRIMNKLGVNSRAQVAAWVTANMDRR
jgi:predicted ATPase/DNA-binding CsgD family transcriptional regulator